MMGCRRPRTSAEYLLSKERLVKNGIRLLAILLIAAPVQVAPALAANNLLGVYADSTGTSACVAASGLVKCYVVLSDVSDSVGVSGWQFALRIDSGGAIFAPEFPEHSLNLEQFPRMMLGCATPVPAQNKMVLMSFSAFATGPASIYVDRLSESLPVLVSLAAAGQLRQVGYEYGGYELPVFAFGGADCPVANDSGGIVRSEDLNWGNLKASYR